MIEFEFSDFSPNKLQDAVTIFKEYAASLEVDLCFQNFDVEMQSLEKMYAPPKGCIILAKHVDEVVGCIALKSIGSNIAEMKRLYVKPSARNKGISRNLVKLLISFARAQNYHTIKLDTLSTMTAAIALYQSFGFVETKQYVHNPFETALFFELNL